MVIKQACFKMLLVLGLVSVVFVAMPGMEACAGPEELADQRLGKVQKTTTIDEQGRKVVETYDPMTGEHEKTTYEKHEFGETYGGTWETTERWKEGKDGRRDYSATRIYRDNAGRAVQTLNYDSKGRLTSKVYHRDNGEELITTYDPETPSPPDASLGYTGNGRCMGQRTSLTLKNPDGSYTTWNFAPDHGCCFMDKNSLDAHLARWENCDAFSTYEAKYGKDPDGINYFWCNLISVETYSAKTGLRLREYCHLGDNCAPTCTAIVRKPEFIKPDQVKKPGGPGDQSPGQMQPQGVDAGQERIQTGLPPWINAKPRGFPTSSQQKRQNGIVPQINDKPPAQGSEGGKDRIQTGSQQQYRGKPREDFVRDKTRLQAEAAQQFKTKSKFKDLMVREKERSKLTPGTQSVGQARMQGSSSAKQKIQAQPMQQFRTKSKFQDRGSSASSSGPFRAPR